jgi:hypothetical protein
VLGFAARIRDRVEERFGVRLTPEPAFWPAGADTLGRTAWRSVQGLSSARSTKDFFDREQMKGAGRSSYWVEQ